MKRPILDLVRHELRCVFVLSTGRAGTSTLTRLLDASPGIFAQHEPRTQMYRETFGAYMEGAQGASLAEEYLVQRLFRYRRHSHLSSALWERLVYAETGNRLTYIAESLAGYFPKAKFIHLHRRPDEIVRSGMRRGWYGSHEADVFRIIPRPKDSFANQWSGWDRFQKCCWFWNACNAHALEFAGKVGSDRCVSLPSTRLFSGDLSELRRIFEWLEVLPPERADVLTALNERTNEQTEGNFPRYEEWSSDMKRTMWSLVAPVATQLQYEVIIG